jgi:hypothetical protein
MSMAYHPTIDLTLFSIQVFFDDWHSECVWLSGRRNARRKQELSANMVILILGGLILVIRVCSCLGVCRLSGCCLSNSAISISITVHWFLVLWAFPLMTKYSCDEQAQGTVPVWGNRSRRWRSVSTPSTSVSFVERYAPHPKCKTLVLLHIGFRVALSHQVIL